MKTYSRVSFLLLYLTLYIGLISRYFGLSWLELPPPATKYSLLQKNEKKIIQNLIVR